MRRFLLALVFALALTGITAPAAEAAPRHHTYTVTRTFGPYNGLAAWWNTEPGQLPDGEALWVGCDPFDRMRGAHYFTINRMGGKRILRVEKKGAAFSNSEPDDKWIFYVFFRTTLQPGWNTVTMTATCRDTTAPYRR